VIFIDTVAANRYERKTLAFKLQRNQQRAPQSKGRVSGHPGHPLDPPLDPPLVAYAVLRA